MSEFASALDISLDANLRADAALDTLLPSSLSLPRCECGSGLHADDCCSLDLTKLKPADPSPENLDRLTVLTAARASVDREQAAAISIAILTEQPTLLEALSALFLIRRSEDKRTAARALIRRLATLVPHESRFSAYLIDGFMEDKEWAEAEAAARKVVRLAPGDARAHDTLGLVLSQSQRLPEGEFHLRRALALGGARTPRLLMHLARNLQAQGRIDDARELFEEVRQIEPGSLEVLLALCELERAAGDFDRAVHWLTQIEERAPAAVEIKKQKAHLAYERGEFNRALDLLETLLPTQESRNGVDAYLLGQTLDKLGRYDEAFALFEAANAAQLNLAGRNFDLKASIGQAQAVRVFMTQKTVGLLPRAGVAVGVAQPLFIVGFGRSGTTMLEQSLSMHSNIMAGGELQAMPRVASTTARLLGNQLGYPFALSELWMGDQHDQIDMLRDQYLTAARRALPGLRNGRHAWFTDKALSQEAHLGLVHLLFPQSPIIHLVRHPLDVIVSGYANAFPHGGYSGGVKEVAQFYLALLESAEHFQVVIPELKCMRVKYEDILEDQEHWTRAMLDFVGESFDPACLQFHENKRHARTISYQQVRQKINSKSKFRYKNYLPHLGPAIEVLAPVIERLGYSI